MISISSSLKICTVLVGFLIALSEAQTGKLVTPLCPVYAPFFGSMGVASALVFTVMGAAYGTAKSGIGISSMGVMKPDFVMKAIIPVIFAGVIAIYGLIISVILITGLSPSSEYTLFKSFLDLGAGLSVGLSGLAAGMCIGIVGDSGVRASARQPRLYVGMILILIFAEALGLYGLIVAIILGTQTDKVCVVAEA